VVTMDMEKQLKGFLTITDYTVRKLLMSKRLYMTMAILLFTVVIMAYATTQDVERLVDGPDLLDLLVVSFWMPVLSMIYGSSLVRDEMDDKSITSVVTSPMDRMVAYTAYYLGLAISVSLILLLILTAGFLSFFGAEGLDGTAWGIYGAMAALVVIGAFAYSALFVMVSVLISKPIFFGLFYAFIWEALIGSVPGNIKLLALKHYIRSIGAHWIHYGALADYETTPLGHSATVLVVFTLVTFIMGAIVFRQTEFT